MGCGITDPLGCAGDIVGSAASSAWDSICQSFATAADGLLKAFAGAFTAIPPVDLASPGVKNVYAICLGIAALAAVLLLLGQVIRTALTHDGSALAAGLTGIVRAAAALLLTLTIASAAITAADALTAWIVDQSFGSAAGLTARITTLISFTGPAGIALGASLLLLLAIIGILLTLMLWFELLLRNAAIVVLVATSPIAAAGQVSDTTRSWWPKLASATLQLIIVKPVIALVFALGFGLTGQSRDIETLLTGMLILLLAVVAWPAVAMFLPFTSVGAGPAGLGALLGFAAGRLSTAGNTPVGVPPADFSRAAEAAGTAGAVTAGAAASGAVALAAAGARAASKAVTALAGQMDQVAGHAGLSSGSQRTAGTLPGPARAAWPAAPPATAAGRGPSASAEPGTAGSGAWPPVSGTAEYPADAGDWPDHDSGPVPPAPAGGGADIPQDAGDWPGHYPGGWSAGEPAARAEPGTRPERHEAAAPAPVPAPQAPSGPGEPAAPAPPGVPDPPAPPVRGTPPASPGPDSGPADGTAR